jgi:hypothetical protein
MRLSGSDSLLPGERKVRFSCGALAGFFCMGLGVLSSAGPLWNAILVGLGAAVLFGWAAARWGDRFWEWLGTWWAG